MMIKTTRIKIINVCLTVIILFSPLTHATTYIVGNQNIPKQGVLTNPPTTDGTPAWNKGLSRTAVAHTQGSTPNMIAKYDWSGGHDSTRPDSGTKGALYCKKDGNDTSLDVAHGYGAPYGNVDGHPIWKTNIPGLYFAIQVTNIFIPMTSNLTPTGTFWLNEEFQINGTSTDKACPNSTSSQVILMGGIQLGLYVYLYADNTFTPQSTISNLTFPNSGYDFRVYNRGATGLGSGHAIKFILNLSGFNMTWPTCAANSVTSQGKKGYTVALGNCYPKEIKDGQTRSVPFTINLASCSYVNNIEVKLDSNSIGAQDQTLLGNVSTNNPAGGVGVKIEGLKNDVSSQMVLIPRDSTSIYKDTNHNDGTASGDRGDNSDRGSATKDLNFQATLKQDGNAAITPGDFKATGKFTINYP